LKDYVNFQYHPRKANMVAHPLSYRSYPALNYLLVLPSYLYKQFRRIEINVITPRTKLMLCTMETQPTLIEEIQAMELEQIREEVLVGKAHGFVIHEDGTIRFHNQVCVLAIEELKKKILDEGYNTPHFMHPGGNKLYKDLNTNVLVEQHEAGCS